MIAEDRTWFYLLRSSAIVCDHDRRSVFPYDRRRSQNFVRSAICDPRSSAIIWKPALKCLATGLDASFKILEDNVFDSKVVEEKSKGEWNSLIFFPRRCLQLILFIRP